MINIRTYWLRNVIIASQSFSIIFFILGNLAQHYYPKRVGITDFSIGFIVLAVSTFITALSLKREIFYVHPPKFVPESDDGENIRYELWIKPYIPNRTRLNFNDIEIQVYVEAGNLSVSGILNGQKELSIDGCPNVQDGMTCASVRERVNINTEFQIILIPENPESISQDRHEVHVYIKYEKKLLPLVGPNVRFVERHIKNDGM